MNDKLTDTGLDDLDRRILQLLAANARMPLTDLARALGVARSTAQARLDRLEYRGHIRGYTIKLGDAARHRFIRATVLAKILPRAMPTIVAQLKKLAEVEVVHTTTGRFDLLMQLAAENTAQLDRILDRIGALEGVQSIETLIHLTTKIDRAL